MQVVIRVNYGYFVSLKGQVDTAESESANVFASITANSVRAGRPDVRSLETYYDDSALSLACIVHHRML